MSGFPGLMPGLTDPREILRALLYKSPTLSLSCALLHSPGPTEQSPAAGTASVGITRVNVNCAWGPCVSGLYMDQDTLAWPGHPPWPLSPDVL